MVDEQERHWTEEVPAFWDVVRGHMDEAGIESVEELHKRLVETEYAYVPTPGRHKGKPVSLKEFKRHLACEHPSLCVEVILGLASEVLGLTEKQKAKLVLSYGFGRPSMDVQPTRPIR